MACEREATVDTKGFDEMLADSVRKYPALYDKTNPSFKDRMKKNSAWEHVAEELNLEGGGTTAEKLFCNLRKRYNKEKAKIKQYLKSGNVTADRESIVGELKLQFLQWLEPYLKPRKSYSKLSRSNQESSEGSQLLDYDEDEEEESSEEQNDDISEAQNCKQELFNDGTFEVVMPEYSQSSETVAKERPISKITDKEIYIKRKRKRQVDLEVESRKPLATMVSRPQLIDSSDNKDECDYFATFVASQLRTLNRMNRLIVQNSIQNTIFHAMIEEQRSSEGSTIGTSSPSCMLCYPNSRKTTQSHSSVHDAGNHHGTFSDVSVNSSNIEHHLQ